MRGGNNTLIRKTMERYDYQRAVEDDVRQYIEDHDIHVTWENRDEVEEQLNDTLFCEDSVTGNASGSYTFSTWKAEENICHNLELLGEACSEFGDDAADHLKKGAEDCDVCIRCYLLPSAISTVLDEILDEAGDED